MRFPTAILATVTLLAVAFVPTNTNAVTGHDCYTQDPNAPTPGGPAPDGAPHCVYFGTGHFSLGLDAVLGTPQLPHCTEAQQGLNYACVYLPAAASDGNVKLDCAPNNIVPTCDWPPVGDDDYFVADFTQEGNTGGTCTYNEAKENTNPETCDGLLGIIVLTTPQVCFLDAQKASLGCFTPAKYSNRVGDGLCSPISTEPRLVPVGSAYAVFSADIAVNTVADVDVFNCPPFPSGL